MREKKSHLWARHPDDWYCEEIWCSERLFASGALAGCKTVLDPACGMGRIVEAAARAGFRAAGSDIVPRWRTHAIDGLYTTADFLAPEQWPASKRFPMFSQPDAIVSNPPFKRAEAFARLALLRARKVVALLLPTTWRHGDERSRWLETTPLAEVLDLCPRPSMPPGPVILAGEKPGGGTKDFSFFIWRHGHQGRPLGGWLRKNDREG